MIARGFCLKDDRVQESELNSLFIAFLNRKRFVYRVKNILRYFMRCLCIRGVNKKSEDIDVKKHALFKKAEEKFNQELDVVRILKSLRKFKMLA